MDTDNLSLSARIDCGFCDSWSEYRMGISWMIHSYGLTGMNSVRKCFHVARALLQVERSSVRALLERLIISVMPSYYIAHALSRPPRCRTRRVHHDLLMPLRSHVMSWFVIPRTMISLDEMVSSRGEITIYGLCVWSACAKEYARYWVDLGRRMCDVGNSSVC